MIQILKVPKEMTEKVQVKLIDYGLASRYLDKYGNHLEQKEEPTFKGNLLFSSTNALEFKTPSRRDDLISLCYMMIFILNGGEFPLIDFHRHDTKVSDREMVLE